jgi:hypothetical protein
MTGVRMRSILAATAVTAAALWAAPMPCAAAQGHLMGVGPDGAPAPKRIRIERQVGLIATVVRYVESHLGVEVTSAPVGRPGPLGSPLELDGALDGAALPIGPSMAGVLNFGDPHGAMPALSRMSAAISAGQNHMRLTLRMRW